MGKEIVLTNWQVPKDPKLARFEALRAAPAIDMKNYENVGSVEHHESVASVAEKMIAKQEAATGRKIDRPEAPPMSALNMGGIVDDRKDKVFFKLGAK